MYEGEEVVLQEGRKGSVQNTVKCYYKNGRLTSEDVIASVVLADPVDEIVPCGNKNGKPGKLYSLYGSNRLYSRDMTAVLLQPPDWLQDTELQQLTPLLFLLVQDFI